MVTSNYGIAAAGAADRKPVLLEEHEPRITFENAGLFFGVPSMNDGLGVQVPRGVGRSDPSDPQGGDREGTAERSD